MIRILLTTLFLFLGFIGVQATRWGSDRSSLDNELSKRKASLGESHDIEPHDNSYLWFLSLVESGIELPHELIRKYTLIAQPYGHFKGVELRRLEGEMCLMVIRQMDRECERYFLLSGDEQKILDQVLLAQKCRSSADEVGSYLDYQFKNSRELEQLQVTWKTDQEEEPRTLKRIFSCGEAGKIDVQVVDVREDSNKE